VSGCCEHDSEHSGSVKCGEVGAFHEGLFSIELVSRAEGELN
jgi:hypothetical protein